MSRTVHNSECQTLKFHIPRPILRMHTCNKTSTIMYIILQLQKSSGEMLYFMMRRGDNLDGFTLNMLFLHYYTTVFCQLSIVIASAQSLGRRWTDHIVLHKFESLLKKILLTTYLIFWYLFHQQKKGIKQILISYPNIFFSYLSI